MAAEYAPEVVAGLQAMVRARLSLWDLPPGTEVTLLNLSENATFGLKSPCGTRDLVLRVHRVGYSSPEEIRSELAWIDALRLDGIIQTAPPVTGANGELVQLLHSDCGGASRFAVAFQRVGGKEPDQGDNLMQWFDALGALTARMHLHSRAWQRPEGFCRKLWDYDAMVGPDCYWGPWRSGIGLDAGGIAVLERALAVVKEKLDAYGMGPDRFGLVHADLRLANLLVEGDTLRVIDFDDCGLSWFIYDFAAAISFIEHEPFIPDLLRAWVAGYRKAAPLSSEDVAMLPVFVILRRILLTAWLASHAEIPFARQIGSAYTAGTVRLAQAFLDGEFLTIPKAA
ncbi:phosphotransferase enzyme family protein [Azospirillum endophyticum]